LETRPTGDRLKETLFNIIGPVLREAVVLDAFSGSGAIGIEAISRGASHVVFIENAEVACRLIRHNLGLCGVKGGYRLMRQDVFAALRFLARQGFKANVLFFDPPYDFEPYADLLDISFARGLLAQPACLVIEHHRKASLPESGENYSRFRLLVQGDHCLSFYEDNANPQKAPETCE
jgi:16S rRNA (guanine966-N2)-methyltransferase